MLPDRSSSNHSSSNHSSSNHSQMNSSRRNHSNVRKLRQPDHQRHQRKWYSHGWCSCRRLLADRRRWCNSLGWISIVCMVFMWLLMMIEAKPSEDKFLEYVRCVKKSGNRTLRVIFQDFRSSDEPAQAILRQLTELGCSYEGMRPRLVSINVPPKVELQRVTDFLTDQSGTRWEYADPTYEQVTEGRPA